MHIFGYVARNVLFVLFGLIFGYEVSYAQTITIKGQVLDEKKQPVSYASVVISTDSVSKKDISYAVTDEHGQFRIGQLSAIPDKRWIHVRSIGYLGFHKQISLRAVKSPLDITLTEDTKELEEVVVVARARDAYAKGDTIVFNSKNYTLGNERNLGDVVKKMPGMEVDQTGNISYQGKKIGKVLVDGQDILSSSSGVAMNTLPPDFANSIELLSNYTDGDIAHAFKAEEQLALNLKSNKKVALSGSFEGGGGLKDKFISKASLITVLPKISASTIINANNTGEAVFSIQDYMSNIIDFESIRSGASTQTSLSLSPEEQQLLLPPTNEHARTAGLANINISWTPHSSYKLRASTLFNKGKSEGAHTKTDTYTLPENYFTNISTGIADKETQLVSQYLSQKWIPSRFFSVSAKTKIDIRNHNADNIYANTFNDNHIHALEKPKNHFSGIKQDIEMKWLLSKGLLFGGGSFVFNKGKINSDIYTDVLLLPLPHINGNSIYPYFHEHIKKDMEKGFNAYVGGMYPVLNNIYLRGEFSMSMNWNELKMAYPTSINEETADLRVFRPYISLMKNKGVFRFNIGSYFSSYRQKTSPELLREKSLFYIEPHASIELVMSNQHRLMLSVSEAVSPSTIDYFSQQILAKGYNNLQLPSKLSNPFAKRFKGNLSYAYFSLFNRLSMYGNLSYIKDRDTHITVTTSKGLLISNFYQDGGWSNTLRTNAYLSKGIGTLPLDIKLSGKYTLSKHNLMRVDKEDELINKRVDAKLDLISRLYQSPVNFEIGVRFSRLDQKFTYSDIHSWNQEFGGFATTHVNIGNFVFSVSGKSNRIEDAEAKRYFRDLDFSLKYKLSKLDIKLQGENVFHLKDNEWMKEILTPTVQSTILYRRLPGHFLLSLSYTL